jgi:hypothetical protein
VTHHADSPSLLQIVLALLVLATLAWGVVLDFRNHRRHGKWAKGAAPKKSKKRKGE